MPASLPSDTVSRARVNPLQIQKRDVTSVFEV
jgi:hypothetical protein